MTVFNLIVREWAFQKRGFVYLPCVFDVFSVN